MAYRLRATVNIDWVAPGSGPMEALLPGNLPGGGSNGQTIGFVSKPGGYVISGTGASLALAAADVTALLASLSSDMSTQINAAIATPQGWVSGNP